MTLLEHSAFFIATKWKLVWWNLKLLNATSRQVHYSMQKSLSYPEFFCIHGQCEAILGGTLELANNSNPWRGTKFQMYLL